MAENMQVINTEEIMKEIKAQIAERGYSENELKFADVAKGEPSALGEIPDYFEFPNFDMTIDQMDVRKELRCWQPLYGNKIVVLVKKVIRKLVKFYVEPIVNTQNEFNYFTTSALSQLRAKYEEEQEIKLLEMQKRIEELEKRCIELEKKCGE